QPDPRRRRPRPPARAGDPAQAGGVGGLRPGGGRVRRAELIRGRVAGRARMAGPASAATRMTLHEGALRAPAGARFAIIASRWNPRITDALVAGARQTFADNGVAEAAIDVVRVPGAWEIPLAAARIAA